MAEKVVVAGAGFAGVTAALELVKKGYEVELIDRKPFHLYVPGIINIYRERVPESSLKRDLTDICSSTGVEFTRAEITDIDTDAGKVTTSSGEVSYDHLVVALGAEPRTFGMDLSTVDRAYTLSDVKDTLEDIDEFESVAVIGAGYTGVEIAAALNERDKDVTIVDAATRPMSRSSEKVSHKVLDFLNDSDISFRGGQRVTRAENGVVEFESNDYIQADKIIWAGGIQASKIVQDSFDVGPSGVPVNNGFSAEGYENVFVVGDSADSGFEKLAQLAHKEGKLVAENIDRDESQPLKEFKYGDPWKVVSLGKIGLMMKGDFSVMGRPFRFLKDIVRWKYFIGLRLRCLTAKLLS